MTATIKSFCWLLLAVGLAEFFPPGLIYLVSTGWEQAFPLIRHFFGYSAVVWIVWGILVVTMVEGMMEFGAYQAARLWVSLFAVLIVVGSFGFVGLCHEFFADDGAHLHDIPHVGWFIAQSVVATAGIVVCVAEKWLWWKRDTMKHSTAAASPPADNAPG